MKPITPEEVAALSRRGSRRHYSAARKLVESIRAEYPHAGPKTICTLLARRGIDVSVNTVHSWIYQGDRRKAAEASEDYAAQTTFTLACEKKS